MRKVGRPKRTVPDPRVEGMEAMFRAGKTAAQIGAQYGISYQRVIQLLDAWSDLSGDEGRAARRTQKIEREAARVEARSYAKWGCSQAEYLSLRGRPMRAFAVQRRHAEERGIEWHLTLWQWWTIWRDSGRWPLRGCGQGYVMCRNGDSGPYATENVFIAPAIENSSDTADKKSGLPIGVFVDRSKPGFKSRRMLAGKMHYLGTHRTPESAHAAYLSLGPIGGKQ